MSTVLFNDLSSYFNNIDPEDPVYQKDLIRPAEIKEDVKLMEQRKRVTNIMRSKYFKNELENIYLKYKFDDEDAEFSPNLSLVDIPEQYLLTGMSKGKKNNLNQFPSKTNIIYINDLTSNINLVYDKAEQQSRCKLASLFRLIDMYGWISNFKTFMSARPFSEKEQFIINPFGLLFHEITASSLISMDFKGNILDFGSTIFGPSSMNWQIHCVLYMCRSNIRAILEMKTSAAIAICSMEQGLLPICRESIILGQIAIIDYFPLINDDTNSQNLNREDLQSYFREMVGSNIKVLIIPNCGFVICGNSIEEAWNLFMNCQIACETQLKLGNLSVSEICIPDANIHMNLFNHSGLFNNCDQITISESCSKNDDQNEENLGELEFEALMRHMDNNGYRTGYIYSKENMLHSNKSGGLHERYEVEVPPATCSLVIEKDSKKSSLQYDKKIGIPLSKAERLYNTPNKYKLIEDDAKDFNTLQSSSTEGDSRKTSAKWISTKIPDASIPIPQHPVTAGAYVAIGHQSKQFGVNKENPLAKINLKELIENQKRVKNKYYNDTTTAGPMSYLLDAGLRSEARMKTESLRKQMGSKYVDDQIVTFGSKGIIQRGHKALVYQDLYKSTNPFDVSADELANYHKEIDRKLNPLKYQSTEPIADIPVQEEIDEVKITISQAESSFPTNIDNDIEEISCRETEISNQNEVQKCEGYELRRDSFECHSFFHSDFDEDFNNLKLVDSIFTSSPKKTGFDLNVKGDHDQVLITVSTVNSINCPYEDVRKSASMKDIQRKNVELLENRSSTLAAPSYGTITSETSGVDISNDELDKDSKSTKKKRKFKLPSFQKKKKDKSK